MPKNMNSDQKKKYARYLELCNSFLSDSISPDQREACQDEMIRIEKSFGIQGDWT